MAFTGKIRKDIIPGNNYEFSVAGTPITVTKIDAITQTAKKVTLPDFSYAATGTSDPIEFVVTVPAHHTENVAFMDQWAAEAVNENVPLTAYRPCALSIFSNSGANEKNFVVVNAWIDEVVTPELSLQDGAESMTEMSYKICADFLQTV